MISADSNGYPVIPEHLSDALRQQAVAGGDQLQVSHVVHPHILARRRRLNVAEVFYVQVICGMGWKLVHNGTLQLLQNRGH